ALLRLGIQKDQKIAVISSTNRTEWNIMDIGILQTGAQNVPIYPTISEEDYQFILNHSESDLCFVSDKEVFDKLNSVKSNIPILKDIYSFDEIPRCKDWKELLEMWAHASNQHEDQARKDSVKTHDSATLIDTFGTTGRPNGVTLAVK